jgi:8-oxo-dGTP pyrophosphatase MutT (NUDIX family)
MWKNQAHRESQDDSMTDFIDSSGFRANVGIVLIRGKGDVFLGGRTGGRGWQFPQGGIGRDEDPEEGMFRELKEEIGLNPAMSASSPRRGVGCVTACPRST